MLTVLVAAWLTAVSLVQSELVVVREGDKQYHRPGCAMIRDGKDVAVMARGEAEVRQLKPHPDCDPSRSTQDAPAPAVYVFLDDTTYYHREKCARLGPKPRRVSLEDAAKKYWPCKVCKPPIRARKSSR